MKRWRVIIILSVCMIATVLVTLGSAAQRDRNCQVEICHLKANGEYVTISVGAPVLDAHLAHGDYLGACVVP